MKKCPKLILDTIKSYRASQRKVQLRLSISLNKAGLTPLQYNILEILYYQGELNITDVMKQSCATKGNMTVVLKNMMERGWIYRINSGSDKRCSIIGLLPEGKRKTEEYLPIHHHSILTIFEDFTEEELLAFGKLLNKMK